MDDNTNDGAAQSHSRADPVVRDEAAIIRQELEEIDKLPLPPHLADKPLDYFAQIARRAAQEVISRLPKGELPSPIVLSALNAGLPTPAPELTNGDRIGDPSARQPSTPEIV